MAARNFFGGVASLFLMLAKIILCLLFAVCDRLIETRDSGGGEDKRTPRPVLGT